MIYILDGGGQYVGPFKNRENVKRFIEMMALCGEDWADRQVVKRGGDDAPELLPARMESCADRPKSAGLELVERRTRS